MSTEFVHMNTLDAPWISHSGSILIGKDILELLSNSMYVDPMAIFREYIQNAADATDEAREIGLIERARPGRVKIEIDTDNRTIRYAIMERASSGIGLLTACAHLVPARREGPASVGSEESGGWPELATARKCFSVLRHMTTAS
jgi:molecular chaperone HtpG